MHDYRDEQEHHRDVVHASGSFVSGIAQWIAGSLLLGC